MLNEFQAINNHTQTLVQNLHGIRETMGFVGRELSNLRRLTELRDQLVRMNQEKNRLSDEDISKQTLFNYTSDLEDQVCSICLSELKDKPQIKTQVEEGVSSGKLCKLTCGHIFHESCIIQGWIKDQN